MVCTVLTIIGILYVLMGFVTIFLDRKYRVSNPPAESYPYCYFVIACIWPLFLALIGILYKTGELKPRVRRRMKIVVSEKDESEESFLKRFKRL